MKSPTETDLLREDFPPSSYDEWRAAAEALLKGAPFEKRMIARSPEGLTIQPIYRAEDAAAVSRGASLPGSGDFARGARPEGYLAEPWEVAQELSEAEPRAFNKTLLDELGRGQTAVNAIVDLDGSVEGLRLRNASDLAAAFEGVEPTAVSLHFQAGLSGIAVQAALLAWLEGEGVSFESIRGSQNIDPVGVLAATGKLPASLDALLDELSCLAKYNASRMPGFSAVGVDAFPYHNAGATAVEELAAALATGTFYLRQLTARGVPIHDAARQIRFTLPVGGDFFMEVAKFRAARRLWSRIVRSLGGSEQASAMKIHARTGLFNKTRRDPYVNLLRASTEALSAALGGVDSFCVGAFDETLREPSAFARRIARNTQIILQEECNLREVVDPAGGCWYVESLADALGREVWKAFQGIEKEGGIVPSLQSGALQARVSKKLKERRRQLGERRASLIGTNKYPNLSEDKLEESASRKRNKESDTKSDSIPFPIALDADALPKLARAAASGASLTAILASLRTETRAGETCEPLPATRLAAEYEALRDAAEALQAKTGHGPKIFLANLGPLRRHKARADFTRDFFAVGGFDIVASPGLESAEAAADAVAASEAPIAVICGHDDDYAARLLDTLRAIRARVPSVKLVLAGAPGEREAEYRAAGLDDFISIKSDNYGVNRDYLAALL